MSLDVDVFGHQFSLDMQDGLLSAETDPVQESDEEPEVGTAVQ